MMAARHLCLALALILALAGATKRPRSSDSSDTEQDESSTTTTTTVTATTTATATILSSTVAWSVDMNLYFLKRIIQMTGCLFSDAVACSGSFDDPMGHAVILLSNILATQDPEYEPVKSLGADTSSTEQLRHELARKSNSKCSISYRRIASYGADQLQLVAAKRLLELSIGACGGQSLASLVRVTIGAWDSTGTFAQEFFVMKEIFMAAEKTTARFDRSVFVWPAGQSSSSPLHPEERLYAAAVVVMCKRLDVRPASVFLLTKAFEDSLFPILPYKRRPSWRRSTLQVISMATGESIHGLDIGEACKSLAENLGISEPLNCVSKMKRYRPQMKGTREPKLKVHNMPVLTGLAKPLPLEPLAETLPTELRGNLTKADQLLLARSIQLSHLLLSHTVFDHRKAENIFFQASSTIALLLKAGRQNVSFEPTEHNPGLHFTPLDLLKVIAEADQDQRPDLSAVSTVGDVMIVAAQMIFRHLYLALPVSVLATADEFTVVRSPDLYSERIDRLRDVLLQHGAPYDLSDSSTLTELYEETDVILWAAFRISSERRGNLSEAFVLCTREMGEKISIARQHTHQLIPGILRRLFDNISHSAEGAVLELLLYLAPVPKNSSSLQMPSGMPNAPGTMQQALNSPPQMPSAMPHAPGTMHRGLSSPPQMPSAMPHAPGTMHRGLSTPPQMPSAIPHAPGTVHWALSIPTQMPNAIPHAPGTVHWVLSSPLQMPNAMPHAPGTVHWVLSSPLQMPNAIPHAPGTIHRSLSIPPQAVSMLSQVAVVANQATITASQNAITASQKTTTASQKTTTASQKTIKASQRTIKRSHNANRDSRKNTSPVLFKIAIVMRAYFPDDIMPIQSLGDLPSMVLPFLHTDLAMAGELASVNRLAATSQLQSLDTKLKRDKIPFSDTDHATVLLDALVALHFLRKGTVAQLVNFPRTHTSDTSPEDKHNLTRLLVAALFKATSVQLTGGSISAAFSELTRILAEAVKTTTFS